MTDLQARVIISAVNNMSGPMQGASASLSKLSRTMQAAGRSMRSAGIGLSAAVSLPLLGIGKAAFSASADFQDAMNQIVGLVGIPRKELETWVPEIESIAKKTGKPLQEVADALYFITSSGFTTSDALKVLDASAKAAAAGLGETKSIADLVTSAVNAYGKENLSAAEAVDVLVGAVKEGKAEASDMAQYMGKVLPFSSQLGVSFNEAAAAIAAMTRTGTDAATATTQLRAVFAGLLKPSKGAEKALAAMGTSSANLRKELGGENGLWKVLDRLRLMQEKYGQTAMAKVFPNIRALAAVLDLTGKNAKDNQVIFEHMAKVLGLGKTAFEETAGATRSLHQAQVTWNIAMKHLGDTLIPKVVPLMEKFAGLIERVVTWFDKLDPGSQDVIIKVAGALAGLGPALMISGMALSGIGSALAILTGPVGIAAATAGLIIYAAFKHWDEIKPAIDAVKTAWNELVEAVQPLIDATKEVVTAVLDMFGIKIDTTEWSATKVIADALASALKGLATALHTIAEIFSKPFDIGTWKDVFELLRKIAGLNPAVWVGKAIGGALGQTEPAKAAAEAVGKVAPRVGPTGEQSWTDWFKSKLPGYNPEKASQLPKNSPLLSEGPLPVKGKIGLEEPIPLDPVKVEGNAYANLRVTIDGPGRVTNMSSWDDGGAIKMNMGTSMQDLPAGQ